MLFRGFWKSFSENMMRNICIFVSLLLVLPAVCGQTSGLRKYTRYKDWKSWKDAQSFCREKHTDLATVRSAEDIHLSGTDSWSWIGLYREDETSPWKWSRGDKTPTFFNWASGEPKNQHHCVMEIMGKWKNKVCQHEAWFICYDELLVLVKENKTWEEALDHCRSLGGEDSENPVSVFWKHSYDLATLITDDDHDYARERAQQATTDEVWTGLRFLGDGWFWVGGEPVRYQDTPSCPAFGCGVLEKDGSTSFGIRACSQRRNFFCYKRPENH